MHLYAVCIRGCLTKAREFIASYVFFGPSAQFQPGHAKIAKSWDKFSGPLEQNCKSKMCL